jgi:hypothetical protein
MKFIAFINEDFNFDEVIEEIKNQGFIVDKVMSSIRTLSGSSEDKTLKDLKSIKGIEFAEKQISRKL